MSALASSLNETQLRSLLTELGREAAAFSFDVAPNPCVGAAILSEGKVVAKGFHHRWGGDHAEVEAIERATQSGVPRSRWDTLVVTLEPCSSRGKTGPCTQAILEAGIPTVVIGEMDPDPRHQGAGLSFLGGAGIEAFLLEGAASLRDVSPHFLDWTARERIRRPHPWIVAKWAQTRTGQLIPPADHGDGRTISCPDSLADLQYLRASVDAIVTGVGTVVADDPRLTVRLPAQSVLPPARVILDSGLRTTPQASLFAPPDSGESAGPVRILCATGPDRGRENALTQAGAGVVGLPSKDRQSLNLRSVQEWLWGMGYRRVLLECGPRLLRSFFEAGAIDQLRVITGDVIGGRGDSPAEFLRPECLRGRRDSECGEDSVLDAFFANAR